MAVNSDTIIDAAHLAPATASFHPVHMNHSRTRCNVVRYYQRGAGRVAFFTCADVAPGEELLYDYGRAYWRGREHLELP
jgi:SET domain-containing protein